MSFKERVLLLLETMRYVFKYMPENKCNSHCPLFPYSIGSSCCHGISRILDQDRYDEKDISKLCDYIDKNFPKKLCNLKTIKSIKEFVNENF